MFGQSHTPRFIEIRADEVTPGPGSYDVTTATAVVLNPKTVGKKSSMFGDSRRWQEIEALIRKQQPTHGLSATSLHTTSPQKPTHSNSRNGLPIHASKTEKPENHCSERRSHKRIRSNENSDYLEPAVSSNNNTNSTNNSTNTKRPPQSDTAQKSAEGKQNLLLEKLKECKEEWDMERSQLEQEIIELKSKNESLGKKLEIELPTQSNSSVVLSSPLAFDSSVTDLISRLEVNCELLEQGLQQTVQQYNVLMAEQSNACSQLEASQAQHLHTSRLIEDLQALLEKEIADKGLLEDKLVSTEQQFMSTQQKCSELVGVNEELQKRVDQTCLESSVQHQKLEKELHDLQSKESLLQTSFNELKYRMEVESLENRAREDILNQVDEERKRIKSSLELLNKKLEEMSNKDQEAQCLLEREKINHAEKLQARDTELTLLKEAHDTELLQRIIDFEKKEKELVDIKLQIEQQEIATKHEIDDQIALLQTQTVQNMETIDELLEQVQTMKTCVEQKDVALVSVQNELEFNKSCLSMVNSQFEMQKGTVEKLEGNLRELVLENEQYKLKVVSLEELVENMKEEVHYTTSTVSEAQLKSTELSDSLMEANLQLQTLNNQLNNKDDQIAALNSILEKERESNLQMVSQLEEERNNLGSQFGSLKEFTNSIEVKILEMKVANEKMTEVNSQQEEKINKLNGMLESRTRTFSAELDKEQAANIELKTSLMKKEDELFPLNESLNQLQKSLAQYETQNGTLSDEIKELQDKLSFKTEECAQYDIVFAEISNKYKEKVLGVQKLERVNTSLTEQIQMNELKNEKLCEQLASLTSEVCEWTKKTEVQQREFQTLYKETETKSMELSKIQHELKSRMEQCDNYDAELNQMTKRTLQQSETNKKLTKEIGELQNQLSTLKQAYAGEVTQLTEKLEKFEELKNIQSSLRTLQRKNKELENEKKKSEDLLKRQHSVINEWESKWQALTSHIKVKFPEALGNSKTKLNRSLFVEEEQDKENCNTNNISEEKSCSEVEEMEIKPFNGYRSDHSVSISEDVSFWQNKYTEMESRWVLIQEELSRLAAHKNENQRIRMHLLLKKENVTLRKEVTQKEKLLLSYRKRLFNIQRLLTTPFLDSQINYNNHSIHEETPVEITNLMQQNSLN